MSKISLTDEESEIIRSALENAHHLIGDEYQSLCDEDLKENYDQVLERLEKAIEVVREK